MGRFFKPVTADLETEAKEQTQEILAGRNEQLAKFKADHQRDCDGYRFECKRWGDFLTVMVERDQPYDGAASNVASSINLGLCKRIELSKGRGPDLDGVAAFYESGGKAVADIPDSPWPRRMVGDGSSDDSWYLNELDTVVEGVARPAMDDSVTFVGAETTVFAPAGLGETVERAILDELKSGFQRRKTA